MPVLLANSVEVMTFGGPDVLEFKTCGVESSRVFDTSLYCVVFLAWLPT